MEQVAEQNSVTSLKRKRAVYLVIGTASLLVLGLVYAWSIFATPLGEAFGWDRSALSYTFSISMAAFCIGALIGSFIVKRTSIRVAILFAATLQASGFILTSLLASQGIWTLYLFYGVFAGLGCGIGYNTIISTVNLWFPEKVGFSSGILMMGYGFGSLVLGTLANAAIEALGWGPTFIVIGLCSAGILVMLALVLRMPPKNIEEIFGKGKKKKAMNTVVDSRPMIKTSLFYLFFIWAILVFAINITLVGDSKQGALALGVDPAFATLLVGLISVTNGLSRVVIGLVYDNAGLKAGLSIITVAGVIGTVCIAGAFASGISLPYILGALFIGFAAGGVPVMSSSFSRERYGAKNYPRNLATVNLSIAGAAILSSLAITAGRALGGDFEIYAILCGVIALAAAVILLFFRGYSKKLD